MQVADPTSAGGLQAAGVLQADALLLVAEEGLRAHSAQADAQVRVCLREGFWGGGRVNQLPEQNLCVRHPNNLAVVLPTQLWCSPRVC